MPACKTAWWINTVSYESASVTVNTSQSKVFQALYHDQISNQSHKLLI